MILTEAEAITRWCPLSRVYAYGVPTAREMAPTATGGPANRFINADGPELNPETCRCLASGCMLWMWAAEEGAAGERHGYCGLGMGARLGRM